MSMWMYKGFDKDMKCRDFQFKEGETYEEEYAELCKAGFHACEYPLDVFSFYHPFDSVYHEVEMDGLTEKDYIHTKRAATKITVGEEKSLTDMLHDSINWLKKNEPDNVTRECIMMSNAFNRNRRSCAYTMAELSIASVSNSCSVAQVHAPYSIAVATGTSSGAISERERSAAVTMAPASAAVTRMDSSTALTTGETSAAVARSKYSTAVTTGANSRASAEDVNCVAITTGDYSLAEVDSKGCVAVALGEWSLARGAIGSWLVLAEYEEGDFYSAIKEVRSVRVDGITILPDVWYKLENGEIKMVKEET